MSDREAILGRVRAALGRTGAAPPPATAGLPPPLVPARARGEPAALVARFIEMATEVSATVDRVPSESDVPPALEAWLAAECLPAAAVLSPDPALDPCGWDSSAIDIRRGTTDGGDRVAVTPAFAGIAETGSLMVRSGATTPYALNFLPDAHVAILPAGRIVGSYEDAWAMMRAAGNRLPRTVTLITGPSRSSDIERTVTIGVHGPGRLHIVIVGKADGE